jgi:hypothetical protein
MSMNEILPCRLSWRSRTAFKLHSGTAHHSIQHGGRQRTPQYDTILYLAAHIGHK